MILYISLSLPVGVLIGLLINYLADVLPATRRFSQPNCEHCQKPWTFVSYVFRMRCPHCKQGRPLRWVFVNVGSVLACIFLVIFPLSGLDFWAALPFMTFLAVIAVIDCEHGLVLIQTSLFGLVLCFGYGVFLHGLTLTLIGGVCGLLIMLTWFLLGLTFSQIATTFRGGKASPLPFGFGDVFAGAFLGLLTGWSGIIGGFVIGIIVFAVYGLVYIGVLLVTGRYRPFATVLPLTPFLIAGSILMLYLNVGI